MLATAPQVQPDVVLAPDGKVLVCRINEEIVVVCLKTLEVLKKKRLEVLPLDLRIPEAKPDSLIVATLSGIQIYSLPQLKLVSLLDHPEHFPDDAAALSLDVSLKGNVQGVFVVRAEGNKLVRCTPDGVDSYGKIAFHGGRPLFACEGANVAVITPKSKLRLFPDLDWQSTLKFRLQTGNPVTCMAMHPSDAVVAIGDERGRVLVVQQGQNELLISTTMHWHSLPLKCVAWSENGSFLYSGGHERAVVKWRVDNRQIEKIAPRLGEDVFKIVAAGQLVVAQLQQCTLLCFDTDLMPSHRVQVGPDCITASRSPLLWHRQTSCIAFRDSNGQFQLYDPDKFKTVLTLEVEDRNVVRGGQPRATDQQPLLFALSQSGRWLSTVHDNNAFKNWEFDVERKTFSLSSCIVRAHVGSISDIRVCEAEDMQKVVTCGDAEDPVVKIWVHERYSDWFLSCAFTYKNYVPLRAALSGDLSVLCGVFQRTITVWDAREATLKSAICVGDDVTSIECGKGSRKQLVFVSTGKAVMAWDMTTLRKVLSVALDAPLLWDLIIPAVVISSSDKIYTLGDDLKLRPRVEARAESLVYDPSGKFYFVQNGRLACSGAPRPESESDVDQKRNSAPAIRQNIPFHLVSNRRDFGTVAVSKPVSMDVMRVLQEVL